MTLIQLIAMTSGWALALIVGGCLAVEMSMRLTAEEEAEEAREKLAKLTAPYWPSEELRQQFERECA